jgi:peptidoglycan/xylan/chitin deacetylase (PgdA/CDA1 family)
MGLVQYPVILTYHRIARAETDPWGLAVPPHLFEEQLVWLSKYRRALPLDEFARLHDIGQLPSNAVSITFDDGYACNALVAAPLLIKYGLPATIFITTAYISSNHEFWWDALEHIIFDTRASSLSFALDREVVEFAVGPMDRITSSSNWGVQGRPATARQTAYLECWAKLRGASEESRRRAMSELHRQACVPATARSTHRAMTADEVIGLTKSHLIDIGAHGVTHSVLDQLSPAEQRLEIRDSRRACADLCGWPPYAFSYPYGDYNCDTVKLVQEEGFRMACTATPRALGPRGSLLELPRVGVGAWTAEELGMQIAIVERQ